eukprot:364443-Chlamydomonas_euryale.AAC.33
MRCRTDWVLESLLYVEEQLARRRVHTSAPNRSWRRLKTRCAVKRCASNLREAARRLAADSCGRRCHPR